MYALCDTSIVDIWTYDMLVRVLKLSATNPSVFFKVEVPHPQHSFCFRYTMTSIGVIGSSRMKQDLYKFLIPMYKWISKSAVEYKKFRDSNIYTCFGHKTQCVSFTHRPCHVTSRG